MHFDWNASLEANKYDKPNGNDLDAPFFLQTYETETIAFI